MGGDISGSIKCSMQGNALGSMLWAALHNVGRTKAKKSEGNIKV